MNKLEQALLRDGTSIVLRDVVPDDRAELAVLFGRMSPLSRHHRYFGALAEPDLRWIDRMTDTDIAVVAVDAGRIVGLGRCVSVAPHIAELAFDVGDKDQHRGIGTLLLEYLASAARTRGISAFRADVEADNKDMVEVFEHSGFVLRASADRDGYHVVFSIDDTERYARAVAERVRIALHASRDHDGLARMETREEPTLGVRFLAPAGWHRTDISNVTKVILFSPTETDKSTRISLLQFPVSAMPAGLETREAGIQKAVGPTYHRIRFESATVVRRPATVLEYTTQIPSPIRTIEYGLRAGNKFFIFQFVAPVAEWASVDGLFKTALASLELFDTPRPPNETATVVAMRDGIRLYTYVVLPSVPIARVPTLLIRSPYYFQYFDLSVDAFRPFTERGYALVYQAVRGTGESEGQLRPMSQEFADGQDAVRWIAEQPWSNGVVGTFGSSYDGFTALAAAVDTPEVKLVLADGAPSRAFETWPATQNGIIQAQLLWWDRAVKGFAGNQDDPAYRRIITKSRPVRELDVAAFGVVDPVWRATLPFMERHDAHWDDWSLTNKLSRIRAPVIIMQAKNEFTSDGLDTFLTLRERGDNDVRAAHRFVLHAGDHGEAIYHPFASTPAGELIQSYLTKYLEGESVAVDSAPVHYFVQNANEWHTADRWPVGGKTTTLYLDARDTRLSDAPKGHPAHFGGLLTTQPSAAGSVTYTFDPAVDDACDPNVFTERLVFASQKLSAPLDTVGRAELVLFVKIDTPDTDLIANVFDDAENPVGQGVGMRLRFRRSMTNPELMRVGEVAEVHLQLNAVAFRFASCSSIRLVIKSTACGVCENPNTGGSMTDETETRPVKVEVLTGPAHPSRLIVPTL